MRVAFDSRAAPDPRGVGRYAKCLLEALRDTAPEGAEIVEAHRPPRADVFHSPWLDGALLRSPCPMVVTLHDLVALKRRSEYLHTGRRFRLRYLAAQRAVRVIVPTRAVGDDAVERLGIEPERVVVIGKAPAPLMFRREQAEIGMVAQRYGLPDDYLLW